MRFTRPRKVGPRGTRRYRDRKHAQACKGSAGRCSPVPPSMASTALMPPPFGAISFGSLFAIRSWCRAPWQVGWFRSPAWEVVVTAMKFLRFSATCRGGGIRPYLAPNGATPNPDSRAMPLHWNTPVSNDPIQEAFPKRTWKPRFFRTMRNRSRPSQVIDAFPLASTPAGGGLARADGGHAASQFDGRRMGQQLRELPGKIARDNMPSEGEEQARRDRAPGGARRRGRLLREVGAAWKVSRIQIRQRSQQKPRALHSGLRALNRESPVRAT